MRNYLKSILFVFLAIAGTAKAQEVELTPIDTLAANVQKLNADVISLKRLKVSGYIQAQYQKIETIGGKTYEGGDFPALSDNRFMLRRARVKFTYDTKLAKYVFNIDLTEKGAAIKDMYINVMDPFMKAFSVTAGVFNRPFGYEIPYSSSSRESPERSRFTQTLFPGERESGAMLTFQMPKTSPLNFLKIDAGLFNGNGTNPEFDKKKDFIAHAAIEKTAGNRKVKYGLGVSYYNGGVLHPKQTAAGQTNKGVNSYEISNGAFVANSDTAAGSFHKRTYMGVDAQLTVETPLGFTSLRGEYLSGQQPGTAASTSSTTSAPLAGDAYMRKVSGAYVYFVQTFAGTKLGVVAKWDVYDPNTNISGDQIGLATAPAKATTAGDLKYTTTGLGLLYNYTPNVRLTAYYDMVKNETSKNLKGYNEDLKDNVFTLRLQYKF